MNKSKDQNDRRRDDTVYIRRRVTNSRRRSYSTVSSRSGYHSSPSDDEQQEVHEKDPKGRIVRDRDGDSSSDPEENRRWRADYRARRSKARRAQKFQLIARRMARNALTRAIGRLLLADADGVIYIGDALEEQDKESVPEPDIPSVGAPKISGHSLHLSPLDQVM